MIFDWIVTLDHENSFPSLKFEAKIEVKRFEKNMISLDFDQGECCEVTSG